MADLHVNLLKICEPDDLKEWRWRGEDSLLAVNPRWSFEVQATISKLEREISSIKNKIWVLTSGSQGHPKAVGIDKGEFLEAAELLGKDFDFKEGEGWLNPLPVFHVGGLSIHARAEVFGQRVFTLDEWNPEFFVEQLKTEKISWTSLVPTQVYDLLKAGRKSPETLRGIFVGGGKLEPHLHQSAKDFGWPLLPTYGMSEASSQIATAPMRSLGENESPRLTLRRGLEVKTNADSQLAIKGVGVTDVLAIWEDDSWLLTDPKDGEGFYWTQDLAEIHGRILKPLGRRDEQKKIKGELVHVGALQERLDRLLAKEGNASAGMIHFLPEDRDGHVVVLVTEKWNPVSPGIVEAFNLLSAPYERITKAVTVDKIPRSDLGKVLRGSLTAILTE